MNNKKTAVTFAPVLLGVLGVLFIYDVVSVFQNFYYHQKKHLIDFLPAGGFILILCFLVFVGVILQFILFKFLYKFNSLFKFIMVIAAISILIIFSSFVLSKSFSMGLFLFPGFLIYSLLNYASYKKIVPEQSL